MFGTIFAKYNYKEGRMFEIVNYLQSAMDIASLRHNVISSNIANADTPGYKSKIIPFKDILKEKNNELQLKTTNPKHIKGAFKNYHVKIETDKTYTAKNDGNNVKMDEQMYLLAKNQILFNALTNFTKYKFNQYRNLISSSNNI